MQREWTGERLETFVLGDATIEHLHRYAMAMDLVHGKRVLDIACGEGYGSNLLASAASFVDGVDIDQAIIEHASRKYKKQNLSFTQGSVEKIPFDAHTFDVVISFETLEHIAEHTTMLNEIKRVLKPGGLALISTPDKKLYADIPNYKNPFHKKELYLEEFEKLIDAHFKYSSVYYQNLQVASLIMKSSSRPIKIYEGDYNSISNPVTIEPLFFIALCSDQELPELATSIFTSKGTIETLLLEKEQAIKNLPSYKLGHFLLSPLKFIARLFNKNNNLR